MWGFSGGDPRKTPGSREVVRQEKGLMSRLYFGYLGLKPPEASGAREHLAVLQSVLPEEGGAGYSHARLPEILI